MKKISIFKLHGQEVLWALNQTQNAQFHMRIYLLILELQKQPNKSFRSYITNFALRVFDVFVVRLHIVEQFGTYEITVPEFWTASA